MGLCSGQCHGPASFHSRVTLESGSSLGRAETRLQGAPSWAVSGLCQDLPFPVAAGLEEAGLLCPATSQANSREGCVQGKYLPLLWEPPWL